MLLFANSMIILGGHRANTGRLYTRYSHIHALQAKNAVLGFGPWGLHMSHQVAYRLPILLFANTIINLGAHRANMGSLYGIYMAVTAAHALPRAHFEPILAVFGPWGCTQATKWHIDCPYCFPPTVLSIWGATGPTWAVYMPPAAAHALPRAHIWLILGVPPRPAPSGT